MRGSSVIIRYARVLHDVASKTGTVEIVSDDLMVVKKIMDKASPIREYCLKSHKDRKKEMDFIETAFIPYVSNQTQELLRAAVRNGRLAALPYLFDAFNNIKDAEAGIVKVDIESAAEMDKDIQDKLGIKMEDKLKHKVRLKMSIVPRLIRGFRLLWDDRMIDMSVLGRVKRMRVLLKKI